MTALHDPSHHDFGSDNYAGAHPEVLAAIAEAAGGHVPAYGADPYTARLGAVLSQQLGAEVDVYPVLNGTGANVISLQSMLPRWGAVICTATAHVNTDENAAPERVAGLKLLPVETPDGKLTPELVATQLGGRGDAHRAQPGVVSITQSTELGTAYTPAEIRAITEHAHSQGLRVHLDGSRLSNAAAHLDVPLRALTTDVGVDVVSLGGTKNGALLGEAIVVLDRSAVEGIDYLRKIDLQLASKMRFVSAQLLALYEGDLWLRSARHANAMAARLRSGLERVPGIEPTYPTEGNAVFVRMPAAMAAELRQTYHFYDWAAETGEVRLMCAFDTEPRDVDAFVAAALEAATVRA
ncbi:threonine aldolase family protein [Cellulomonas sp. SG140]|uniref:threonine aldolase family protein n=1 Tax=Cellulomonas sp. SG140 TaxID=2976536 RepID=UPI0021E79ADF|nr:low specificity L-threonine aldolase [Cellulomonas sp. SG140]